jgi:SAM-dependent methyltransferase
VTEETFHDDYYSTFATLLVASPLMRAVHRRVAADLVRKAGLGRVSTVLSLGCGEGQIERFLAAHVGRVVGIDISEVGIARARERAREAGVDNAEFEVASVTALPAHLRATRWDAITAFGVLHHIPDDAIAALARDCHAMLGPGGTFHSIDPSVRRLIGLLKSLVGGPYRKHHSPDERELVPERVAAAFRAAGYDPVEIDYADYFVIPLAFIFPRLGQPAAAPILALDRALRALPGVRRLASSFAVTARV